MADLPINESDGLPVIVTDATTATRQMVVNSDGSFLNSPVDGKKATYSVGSSTITPATAATDIWAIFGNGSKTVRVLSVQVSGNQTTGGEAFIQLFLRSSANSGGTPTSFNGFKHDSTNPTSSSVVTWYAANPSTGTLVGSVRTGRIFLPAAASTSAPSNIIWEFGNDPGQAIVLRGTGEGLTLNLNGTTITGGAFFVSVTWTEE